MYGRIERRSAGARRRFRSAVRPPAGHGKYFAAVRLHASSTRLLTPHSQGSRWTAISWRPQRSRPSPASPVLGPVWPKRRPAPPTRRWPSCSKH